MFWKSQWSLGLQAKLEIGASVNYAPPVAEARAKIEIAGDAVPAEARVVAYQAREAISQLFSVQLEFALPQTVAFVLDDCLRSSVALTLVNEVGQRRYFHGVVDQAEYRYFTGTEHHFSLRLRPTIAALAHRENCKIWQEKNIVEIAQEVFDEAGVDNAEFQLVHLHEPRTYCVQYRESELNFILRLFEDEGLFYFFRHSAEGHKMIIADDASAYSVSDDLTEVTFAMSQGTTGEPLENFERTRSMRTNVVHLRDYDFEQPAQCPDVQQPVADIMPLRFYSYPAGFTASSKGGRMATARLQARRHDVDLARGSSRAIGLSCGVPFSVEAAEQSALIGRYVVTELETTGKQSLGSSELNEVCVNRFVAVVDGQTFVPKRAAKRPHVRGIQTAVVTGPSTDAEAIHVDNYGRIKVRFYWDRINQQDDTSSCWLRVAQVATGGSMLLPRVGWEVAVAFMEGDPDRPFVMGRLYNGEKVPPAGLPGAKASGGLKSYSTPGGAGTNELNLSDSAGSMGFTLNAQKDLNVNIGNDKNETIAVDSSQHVQVTRNVIIGGNESVAVGSEQTVAVGSVRSNNVSGSQTIDVSSNETNNATANMLETVTGDRSYKVGANKTIISNTVMQTVTGNVSRKVDAVQFTASIASITDQIGADYKEDVAALKGELMIGTSSETVGGNKNQTSIAAELHVLGGGFALEGSSSVTYMVGGVHYQKIDGDLSIKAPLVTLLGATGDFKGGSGNLKLGGGPVVAKGSKIAVTGALSVKLGASLKLA